MELKPAHQSASPNSLYLLIVPYGIETAQIAAHFGARVPFNRTLWN